MKALHQTLLAFAMAIGIGGQVHAQSGTLITNVKIVNVSEGTLTMDQSVLIRDGVIVRVLANDSIALDRRTFLMAHAAGVPILASSDASFANPYLFHGFSLIDELQLYVTSGLSPREALYTATVAPARFFGFTDQDGTIAPGKRADLVLLAANPLENLATLRRPHAVIAGGRVLKRADLDQLEATLLKRGE